METLARAKRRVRTESTVFMAVMRIENDGQRDQDSLDRMEEVDRRRGLLTGRVV